MLSVLCTIVCIALLDASSSNGKVQLIRGTVAVRISLMHHDCPSRSVITSHASAITLLNETHRPHGTHSSPYDLAMMHAVTHKLALGNLAGHQFCWGLTAIVSSNFCSFFLKINFLHRYTVLFLKFNNKKQQKKELPLPLPQRRTLSRKRRWVMPLIALAGKGERGKFVCAF